MCTAASHRWRVHSTLTFTHSPLPRFLHLSVGGQVPPYVLSDLQSLLSPPHPLSFFAISFFRVQLCPPAKEPQSYLPASGARHARGKPIANQVTSGLTAPPGPREGGWQCRVVPVPPPPLVLGVGADDAGTWSARKDA